MCLFGFQSHTVRFFMLQLLLLVECRKQLAVRAVDGTCLACWEPWAVHFGALRAHARRSVGPQLQLRSPAATQFMDAANLNNNATASATISWANDNAERKAQTSNTSHTRTKALRPLVFMDFGCRVPRAQLHCIVSAQPSSTAFSRE